MIPGGKVGPQWEGALNFYLARNEKFILKYSTQKLKNSSALLYDIT